MEQVRVESSTMRVTRYLACVHVMLSASTSLPQASVSAIYTVSPFRLVMMSPGRQLRLLMKFQAIPSVAVTLMGNFSRAINQMAARQLQAPLLSRNMDSILWPVRLRSSPPESKQMPFPINASQSSLLLSPRQLMLIRAGSLLLALPTAWNRFSPSFLNSQPLMAVIPRPSSSARCLERWMKQAGDPKWSPLPLANIALFTRALAREVILSACWEWGQSATVIEGGVTVLVEQEQAEASNPLARPKQQGRACTPLVNQRLQLCSIVYFLPCLAVMKM